MKDKVDGKEIWKMLLKTMEAIRNFHDRNTPHNLRPKATISHIKVMSCVFLSSSGKIKLKDIAGELGITPGGASQIVDNLVKKGMLKRCQSKDDRRVTDITLSKKGAMIRSQLDSAFGALIAQLLKSVPYAKQFIFYEVLETMTLELKKQRKQ